MMAREEVRKSGSTGCCPPASWCRGRLAPPWAPRRRPGVFDTSVRLASQRSGRPRDCAQGPSFAVSVG